MLQRTGYMSPSERTKQFERQVRQQPIHHQPGKWAEAVPWAIMLVMFAIMGFTALAILSPAVAEWVR